MFKSVSYFVNMRCIVLLFVFIGLSLAQREDKIIIDEFVNSTSPMILIIQSGGVVTASQYNVDSSVLGGERDQILQASGPFGSVAVSQILGGTTWSIGAPRNCDGFGMLQYDGTDGSASVDVDGLGGIDFLADDADAFTFSIVTDLDASVHIIVYSTSGASSEISLAVTGGNPMTEIDAYFADFVGTADFEDVGAIELQVDFVYNGSLDSDIQSFRTTGPI